MTKRGTSPGVIMHILADNMMYNNASHLMISGFFISVLCMKTEQRHSQIKPGAETQAGPACFHLRREYQIAVSAVRCSRGYIGGQRGGLPPAECSCEVLLLAVVLYGKMS